MRKFFVILILIMSVGGWISCNNKQDKAKSDEQAGTQVDSAQVTQALTKIKDLKTKFDAAEKQEEKDDLMNQLSTELQTFLSKNPNNVEANAMMDDVQMYYASQWAMQGKYAKALEILDNVLQFSPNNQKAKDLKAKYDDWQYLTQDEFKKIKKHMYMDEVTELIGYPVRKTESKDKYGRKVYGWFYKEPKLSKAVGIYFDPNGQVYSTKWPK